MKVHIKQLIPHMVLFIVAVFILFVSSVLLSKESRIYMYDGSVFEARVSAILEVDDDGEGSKATLFEAEVLTGSMAGETIESAQYLGGRYASRNYFYNDTRQVSVGDKVLFREGSHGGVLFYDFVRHDAYIYVGIIFILLLAVFGRLKGVNSLLTLGLTVVTVFIVIIPAVLAGHNPYVIAGVSCLYLTLVSVYFVYGFNKMSTVSVIGCFGGVIAAGALSLLVAKMFCIEGVVDNDSVGLSIILTDAYGKYTDLQGVIFIGAVLGALGGVMDVSVSIASALRELKAKVGGISFGELLKSGLRIGKDMMCATTNTLVMAYVGGSMVLVVHTMIYSVSFVDFINREAIVVTFLPAIVGSLAIFLSLPLTVLACSWLYTRENKDSRFFKWLNEEDDELALDDVISLDSVVSDEVRTDNSDV